MRDQPEPPTIAIMPPAGASTANMGVAAPIGAVSRKDRERAGKTALHREGPSTLLLVTDLPGSVMLQRRDVDDTWETLDKRPASSSGRTPIELPQQADSPPPTFRVVFSPKNINITSWISADIDG